MAEVTTALKVTATADNTLQKTFRDVAAQVETMSARVTRTQRTMVAGHKAAASAFVESAQMVQTSIGKISGAFGIGLGIGALVEAGKKAVTVFATVDEQARALAVTTGRTEEAILKFYERVKQVAGAAAIDADTLRNSFDDLARAIGPEAAAAALPRLAMAAKAMKAPIADVVGLMEQMNDNLGVSADKAPVVFDMIQKGTEGTRTTAAGATKGLADLSLQMRGLGEGGEKGLRSTLGLLIAIGKHAPSTEAAVASLQSLMNKVGTRKTDESLEKLGHVPMRASLDEAKRKHQDEFLVFLNEVDKGLTNMAKEAGTPIASKMQYLQTLIKSPEDRQAIQSILEGMPEYRAIRDREPAQEAGATDKAFRMMRPSASSFLTKLGNAWNEAFEWGGRNIWGTATHKLTEAEKRPDLAAKGLLPPPGERGHRALMGRGKGGTFGDISGNVGDIGWLNGGGARPLIPSEPGSSTERTAREQLEAIRRLERASLFGGGLGGIAAASTPASGGGGGTWAGEAPEGGGHRASRPPGSRMGGPGGGRPLVGGGTPSGGGGYEASPKITSAQALKNRKETWDFLKGKGLSDDAAAGIIGSEQGESNFNPMAKVRTAREHSTGSFQWDRNRQAAIKAATGIDVETASHADQLKAMWWETHHGDKGAQAAMRVAETHGSTMGQVNAAWVHHFERSLKQPADIAKRGKFATRALQDLRIHAPPPVAAAHSQHTSQLEELRRQAAEPVRVKVKYDYEDVRGIRDRGEAQGRRVFNREAKRSRYLSFSDVGVV